MCVQGRQTAEENGKGKGLGRDMRGKKRGYLFDGRQDQLFINGIPIRPTTCIYITSHHIRLLRREIEEAIEKIKMKMKMHRRA